jgi:short-subunit dehydrogenase
VHQCFNNAGFLEAGRVETVDVDRICKMVRANVEAGCRITGVFAKHVVREFSGHLINVSSVLGRKVRPTAGAHAGAKYAIEALSEAHGIKQHKCPGIVHSARPGEDGPA